MSDKRIKTLIADTFLEVADALETGQYGKKPVIGFASEGSEHGEDNIKRAMELAAYKGLDAVSSREKISTKRWKSFWILVRSMLQLPCTTHSPSAFPPLVR